MLFFTSGRGIQVFDRDRINTYFLRRRKTFFVVKLHPDLMGLRQDRGIDLEAERR